MANVLVCTLSFWSFFCAWSWQLLILMRFLLPFILKESAIASLQEWLNDAAIGNNHALRLIAGIIYMHEQNYVEALKHTNSGGTMEL